MCLSYIGNYQECSTISFEEKYWDRIYDYANENNLLCDNTEYLGISYDNSDITDKENCRFIAGVTISHEFKTKLDNEIKFRKLPANNYAVFKYIGSYNHLDEFYYCILSVLNDTHELANAPIIEKYLNDLSDTPENKLITEVWVPIVK